MESNNGQNFGTSQPAEINLAPQPPKKFNKGLLALAALVVVVLGALWMLGGNTKNTESLETKDLKTYSNPQYGFEVKISNDWEVIDNSTAIGFAPRSLISESETNSESCRTGNGTCNSEFLDREIGFYNHNALGNPGNNTETSTISINGEVWTKYKTLGLFDSTVYTITKGTKVYSFEFYTSSATDQAEKFLSTFKITAPVTTTTDWKTHTNADHGFQFQFPADFEYSELPEKTEYVLMLINPDNVVIGAFVTEAAFSTNLIKQFAPTGLEDAAIPTKTFGKNTFYYYGVGGGGVYYPDLYFYNLSGKLLVIVFGDKSNAGKGPSEDTKKLEAEILSTFKLTNTI